MNDSVLETKEYTFNDLLEKFHFKDYGFIQVSKYFLVNIHQINRAAIDFKTSTIHYQLKSLRKGIKVSDSFKTRLDSALGTISKS